LNVLLIEPCFRNRSRDSGSAADVPRSCLRVVWGSFRAPKRQPTFGYLSRAFSLLLKSANIEACQPRCRSTYSYYVKSGIFNGVTYVVTTVFNFWKRSLSDCTTVSAFLTVLQRFSKNLTFSYSRLGMDMERPYLQFRHSRSPILCIIDQDGVESIGPGSGVARFFPERKTSTEPGSSTLIRCGEPSTLSSES
jgi:hypothetical protein